MLFCQRGEVIHIPKKRHPQVIGAVVCRNLARREVPFAHSAHCLLSLVPSCLVPALLACLLVCSRRKNRAAAAKAFVVCLFPSSKSGNDTNKCSRLATVLSSKRKASANSAFHLSTNTFPRQWRKEDMKQPAW